MGKHTGTIWRVGDQEPGGGPHPGPAIDRARPGLGRGSRVAAVAGLAGAGLFAAAGPALASTVVPISGANQHDTVPYPHSHQHGDRHGSRDCHCDQRGDDQRGDDQRGHDQRGHDQRGGDQGWDDQGRGTGWGDRDGSGAQGGASSPITAVTTTLTSLTGGNGGNGGAGTGGAGGAGGQAIAGPGGPNLLSGDNFALLGRSAPSTAVSSGGNADASGGNGAAGIGGAGGAGGLLAAANE